MDHKPRRRTPTLGNPRSRETGARLAQTDAVSRTVTPRRGRPRIWEPDAVRVDTWVPADVYQRLRETADAAGVSVQQITRAIVEHRLGAELEALP